MKGIGYIPPGSRSVKPVPQWILHLVPKPEGKNETVKSGQEDTETDTMPLIRSKIRRTVYQTAKLAPYFKGTSLRETVKNDWKFINDHIQYVKDDPDAEQVRSPRRCIYDGRGDCDCFTVLLSSLLLNQGIPHSLRIIKQGGADHWSHIYIVIPKSGKPADVSNRNSYIALDCVTNRFDYEPVFTQKKDFPMALQYLDGLGDCPVYSPGIPPTTIPQGSGTPIIKFPNKPRIYVTTRGLLEDGYVPTKTFLDDNNVPYYFDRDQESGSAYYSIETKSGLKKIPTVMTKPQAQQLIQEINSPESVASESVVPADQTPVATASIQKADAGWIFGVGIGLLLLGSIFSGSKAAVTAPASALKLGGVKSRKRKAKSTRKYQTLVLS